MEVGETSLAGEVTSSGMEVAGRKMVEVEIYRYKKGEETFLEGEETSSDMKEVKILMVEVMICSSKAHKQPR
jgi:hypothetical protein